MLKTDVSGGHPYDTWAASTRVLRQRRRRGIKSVSQVKRWWGFGMQWHQPDHMQTICTSLQTDNHTNISSLNFYRPDTLPCAGTNYIQGGEADVSCTAWLRTLYLASSFTCVADMPHRRRLRSATTEQLDVPTCRRSTVGGRAFPVAGAKVWNGLQNDVTSASSLSVFKNRLKTYLFRRCYETVSLWVAFFFFLVIISPPEQWSLQ